MRAVASVELRTAHVVALGALFVVGVAVTALFFGRDEGTRARARLRAALVTPLDERAPGFFFLWGCVWLVVLLVLPAMYARNVGNMRDRIADPIAGIIPIGVPLAGALGAVTIGLYGVFRYNRPGDWDPKYAFWHLARPLMGVVLGVFGFLIFVAVIQASGAEVNLTGTTATTTTTTVAGDATADPEADGVAEAEADPVPGTDGQDQGGEDGNPESREGLIVYYIVAFIVGFREESFRELLKRASDLLFRPSGDTGDAESDGTAPQPGASPVIAAAAGAAAPTPPREAVTGEAVAAGVSYEPYLDSDEAPAGRPEDCTGEDPS